MITALDIKHKTLAYNLKISVSAVSQKLNALELQFSNSELDFIEEIILKKTGGSGARDEKSA
ncbi:hypothetical protein ABSA28_00174 [Candidatus Hepatincolaceae symbiont of Richtersius coronifer]